MRFISAVSTRNLLALAAAAVLFAAPARAQFVWSAGGGGNWSTNGNWLGGTAPPVGGGTDLTILFPTGNYTATNDLTGAFSLNALNFNNNAGNSFTIAATGGSSLNFVNTAAAVAPTINIQGAGDAIISSPVGLTFGTVPTPGNLTIGGAGSGNLTFSGAITEAVTNTSNILKTTSGSLTLSGGGSFRQLNIQNGSAFITNGTLGLTADTGTGNVNSGLRVAAQTGGTATTTISGATTIVNVTENTYIADQAGSTGSTSTLIVRDGATLNNLGTAATLGRFGIGNGGGQAELQVLNGGVINANQIFLARIAGSNANVLVDGAGSILHGVTQISLGTAGSGTLTVQNGGAAVADGSINIGRANTAGVSGSLTVTGTNSRISAGTDTVAGQLNVGLAGPGSLTVSNGATATLGTSLLAGQLVVGFNQTTSGQGIVSIQSGGVLNAFGNSFIGTNPGSTGDITVTGAGSQWNQNGQFSMQNGPSSLSVQNGGAFNVLGTGIPFLGTVAGASATLTVSGTGSTFVAPGQFTISGGGGTGGGNVTVNVSSGGAVTAGGLTILGQDPTAGTANVTVNGGAFTANGELQVAPPDGVGNSTITSTINVQGGGTFTVNNSNAFFGIGVGSTVNVNVTGTNSVLSTTGATGQIQFGGSGSTTGGVATVTVDNGGLVQSPTLVAVFPTSTVNVNSGGVLTAPAINVNGRLIANGAVNGAVTVNTGGFLGGTSGISGSIGTITGNVSVNSGGTIRPGDGSATGAGILTVAGAGSAVTVASGATFSLNVNGPTPGNGANNHGQLLMTGGATIDITGSTLQTTLGYAPAPSQVITFISGGAVTGTFTGLPENQLFQVGTFNAVNYFANIHYTSNSVFFTVVPEPVHVLGLGAVVCGGFTWWKKRRNAKATLAV